MSRLFRPVPFWIWASASIFAVPALFSQVYSPLFAPVTGQTEYFTCVLTGTTTVVPNAPWSGVTAPFPGTNAHFHGTGSSGTEPVSVISPASGTADDHGNFNFLLITTLVGQAEKLTLQCGPNPTPTVYGWAVGYNDVYYADHPEIWIKIGGTDTGADTGHGSTSYNRYMQVLPPGILNSGPAYFLYNATNIYLTSNPGTTKVCTNDMALPFGGKFDIKALKGQPWTSPHSAHDRGTAVDVAGQGTTSGQCPTANLVNIDQFLNSCVQAGAVRASSLNEYNHAHCAFADPSTFPH